MSTQDQLKAALKGFKGQSFQDFKQFAKELKTNYPEAKGLNGHAWKQLIADTWNGLLCTGEPYVKKAWNRSGSVSSTFVLPLTVNGQIVAEKEFRPSQSLIDLTRDLEPGTHPLKGYELDRNAKRAIETACTELISQYTYRL